MIRYYYTQLYLLSDANMTSYNEGTLLFQPMFFEFPNDGSVYNDVLNNIMLGSSLKLSVRADSVGQNLTTFYYPAGVWCNVFNSSEPCFNSTTGVNLTLRTKAYDFYVHLREGHIVPMQDATALNINTTAQLQQEYVDFHVLPSLSADETTWSANGLYYNDDGVVFNFTNNSNSYQISVNGKASDSSFTLNVLTITSAGAIAKTEYCSEINNNDFLGRVEIYNAFNLQLTNSY